MEPHSAVRQQLFGALSSIHARLCTEGESSKIEADRGPSCGNFSTSHMIGAKSEAPPQNLDDKYNVGHWMNRRKRRVHEAVLDECIGSTCNRAVGAYCSNHMRDDYHGTYCDENMFHSQHTIHVKSKQKILDHRMNDANDDVCMN